MNPWSMWGLGLKVSPGSVVLAEGSDVLLRIEIYQTSAGVLGTVTCVRANLSSAVMLAITDVVALALAQVVADSDPGGTTTEISTP